MPNADRPIVSFLKTQKNLTANKTTSRNNLTAAIHIYKFKNIRCKSQKNLN